MADDFFRYAVMSVWEKTRAAILERRQRLGRDNFRFLQWLAEAQAKRSVQRG